MGTLRFTDGVKINTDGEYRIIHRGDGYYVVGKGYMCAVDSYREGEELIKELVGNTP